MLGRNKERDASCSNNIESSQKSLNKTDLHKVMIIASIIVFLAAVS